MHANIFEQDLERGPANFVPLSPLAFLRRSASVYPEKTAVIHGDLRYSYGAFHERCLRLASALMAHGVQPGDTVSVMAPNVPALLEAHYGVPMAGAVLNALNYRLDAASVRFIVEHAATRVLIVDTEFCEVVETALQGMSEPPLVVDIDDPMYAGGRRIGAMDYESFLAAADPQPRLPVLEDEWQAISLNYTSGTTGNPKGVVYSHRGAYLNAVGQLLSFGVNAQSVYLWTLPMFHCNGWCYTWGVTAAAATHVCLRRVDPSLIFPLISEHEVSHMCGAPIVLNMLIHADESIRQRFRHTVEVATGGAAPPSAVISAMQSMGFRVTHLYGLTETYGPATVCAWQADWADMDDQSKAQRMARQGVAYHTMDDLMIADPETLAPVPWDGETLGELMLRGNTVMKGYLKNPRATADALSGGWFHTGDLGVRHADGYVEIKDRSKDIIITGGENVSSLEVEEVLYRHPDIMEAAVVGKPDAHWGETVCAFVTLTPGSPGVDPEDVTAFCRQHLARFKIPRTVVFGPLPKTSTGKIQKFVLREQAEKI